VTLLVTKFGISRDSILVFANKYDMSSMFFVSILKLDKEVMAVF
jgi:hypothetical protein